MNNTDNSILTKKFLMSNDAIANFTIVPLKGIIKIIVSGIPMGMLEFYDLTDNAYYCKISEKSKFPYELRLKFCEEGFEVVAGYTSFMEEQLKLNTDGTLIWKENNVSKTY